MTPYPLRLMPGDDVRNRLEALNRETDIAAAFVVAAVGSLSRAAIRFAGVDRPVVRLGSFEIVSMNGTIGRDGAHLHAALADRDGHVFGGHVAHGCTVRTTAEILLVALPGWTFRRSVDPATGYAELQITAPDHAV